LSILKRLNTTRKGLQSILLSLDVTDLPGETGLRAALAVVFTLPLETGSELYETAEVIDFGKYQVDDEASNLLAEIDQQTESLQH